MTQTAIKTTEHLIAWIKTLQSQQNKNGQVQIGLEF